MNNIISELAILVVGLAIAIFSMINLFTKWVPNIYPIIGIVLSLSFHALWSKYYGNKT